MTQSEFSHEDMQFRARELAQAAVRYVFTALKLPLDGTPDTLPILDHYLDGVRKADDSKHEVNELVVSACAAYFGDLVIGQFPSARWAFDSEHPKSWRIEFDHIFLHFRPALYVELALADDPHTEEALLAVFPEDRDAVAHALTQLGEFDEEELSRLSLRFEAVEEAITALERAARARGDLLRTFTPAVYAASLEE